MHNFYLVTIIVSLSGHEKIVTHCVESECTTYAEYLALSGESQFEGLTYEQYLSGAKWEDADMVYEIDSVREVSEAFFTTFNAYE